MCLSSQHVNAKAQRSQSQSQTLKPNEDYKAYTLNSRALEAEAGRPLRSRSEASV